MTIFALQTEIEAELETLGISAGALQKVVTAAAGGYNSTTRFHPKSAPGTYLYQEATAALRRELTKVGYEHDEHDQQPRTYSAERRVAIVVQTGDENTGLETGIEPRTRNPKGSATQKKVSSNVDQLSLFNYPPVRKEVPANGEFMTWILLIAVVGGKIRAELSLPREWSSDGRPCGWLHRILLAEQDLGGAIEIELSDDADAETDVDVSWK